MYYLKKNVEHISTIMRKINDSKCNIISYVVRKSVSIYALAFYDPNILKRKSFYTRVIPMSFTCTFTG